MSFQAMTWAVERPCRNAGQKLVLLMLANHTNGHTGQCNPSHRVLAEECCMGVSTLKNHLQALAEDYFIEIIRRQNEGVDLPNQYRLMLPSPGQKLADGGQNLAGARSDSGRGEGPESGYKPGTISNQELNLEENHARKRAASPAAPDDVSPQVWADWLALRKVKKAAVTATAVEGIKREAQKAGLTLQAALEACCANGWQGFKAEWLHQRQQAAARLQSLPQTREEHDSRTRAIAAQVKQRLGIRFEDDVIEG